MSYARSYALNEDPPMSARDGRSLKEHVELLHLIILKQVESVDILGKKVKSLEEANEKEAESEKAESEKSEKDDEKNEKDEKDDEKKTRFSTLFGISTVAAFMVGLGVYFTRRN
uniref:Uncharacterized protein n=1 Tax=viral metagenome TaxID=1070528 RepID=A0A6C0KG70_9ZZZZ